MKKTKKMVILVLALWVLVISVGAKAPKMLIPGGHTIGMKAYADGLLVTDVLEGSAAQKAGLRQGDILSELEGKPLKTADQLTGQMTDGRPISLKLDRGRETCLVCVRPDRHGEEYRMGAFVRDNVAGIGTVSYYDPEDGTFGALGHGISDLGGKSVLPISGGVVVSSRVCDVVKGVSGKAGQLKGEFSVQTHIGTIEKNTDRGVFGTAAIPDGMAIPAAESWEVTPGSAVILSNVQGDEVGQYDIRILKCCEDKSVTGRNLLIEVTDTELIAKTGGIVQGMSGSPIIQNGKLVGAVTHVLVNEPTKGYGIFIENMLDAAS